MEIVIKKAYATFYQKDICHILSLSEQLCHNFIVSKRNKQEFCYISKAKEGHAQKADQFFTRVAPEWEGHWSGVLELLDFIKSAFTFKHKDSAKLKMQQ